MSVQRLGFVINAILLTLIGYVNAHLITSVIDHNLVAASRPKPSMTGPSAVTRLAPDQPKDFSAVLQKNIFGSITTDEPVDSGVNEDIDTQAAHHTALNLCLVGTVVSSDAEHSFASIQDLDTPNKDVSLHFVGQPIKQDAKLVKVEREVVYFERLGFIEKLVLCEDGKPRPVDAPPPTYGSVQPSSPQAAAPPPRQTGDTQFQLDRATVDQHLSNLSSLLTQARVVPHFNKGKPDGFRIFSIRPDSLFDQIGLKNGDVLRSINSLDITTTEEALQAFTQLRSANHLSLSLERDNSPLSLNYDIR